VFAKDKTKLVLKKLARTEDQNVIYKYSDDYDGVDEHGQWYGRGPWYADNLTLSLASGQRGKQYAKTWQSVNIYAIRTPSGRDVWPAQGRAWSYTQESLAKLLADNRVWFGKNGDNKPTLKRFLSEVQDRGVVPTTNWHYSDVGENRVAMQEMKELFRNDPFPTPKPEKLLQRIFHLSTNPGDLVLDSFAGSGTTGAVAHKMGRRWIMVELGEHCHTHIIPRLKKVIDGEDKGGITEAVGWKGGGGFRYYHLAPSLLEEDKWGNWVINKTYNPTMLSQAVCKLEGFTYAPSDAVYWQQGHSTERDFIYVTTQNLSHDQLQALSDEVGEGRTLLVMCSAFRGKPDKYPNLTIKKIPKTVLSRCEWGHDDYSLKIESLPKAPAPDGQQGLELT
jgi:adenine-specific DNA-methyltransferase